MPRKKRANAREILRKRLEEPENAAKIADALLSFLHAPDKAKGAAVMKVLDFAAEGLSDATNAKEPELPAPSEDLSQYTDAQLWDWLRRLEGGQARGP